jgi:hypothetical protein
VSGTVGISFDAKMRLARKARARDASRKIDFKGINRAALGHLPLLVRKCSRKGAVKAASGGIQRH